MRLALLLFALGWPATAQQSEDIEAGARKALTGTGAVVRGLDKMSGEVTDLTLTTGEIATFGRIEITLEECRYPEDNATGEAYAWIDVHNSGSESPVFAGWMVASSPALSALDHPRYDVWVIRCTTR